MREFYVFAGLLAVITFVLPVVRVLGLPYDVVPPKYLFCCDVNFDGEIDIKDVAIVAKSYGSTPGTPTWNPVADVNQDGRICIRDIALVALCFGTSL